MTRALAVALMLASIIAANVATTRWGFVPVPFGLEATAGTYFAGATFVLRDVIEDQGGRWLVLITIVAGAALSYLVAAPQIAVASGVAFTVSELADWIVYSPLRAHGYVRAAVASNVVGSLVDTVLFLTLAGFPVWSSVPGQMVGKLTITVVVIVLVLSSRAVLRNPQQPRHG